MNRARILLVDDEVMVVNALSRLLSRSGFEVASAPNGRVALEEVRRTPFNLVLCDVRMPVLDGSGFLEELRTHDAPRPPVVMLTGYGDDSDAELVAAGACAVHGKPVDLATLLAIVARWAR